MAARDVAIQKLTFVASVAVAIALGIFAQWLLVYERNEAAGLVLWALAIALFIFALWHARKLALEPTAVTAGAPPPAQMLPRTEAALLIVVLAVGVFYRLYRIQSIPAGLNHDAAWNGLYATGVTPVVDYFTQPYVAAAWGRETMFHQMIAVFQSFLGPSQLAIELPAVAVGVVTLPAMYLLMRRLYDTHIALVATFLLAVSGWHVTFSKVGWRVILVPLFYVLVFYFLVKAVQGRNIRHFAAAGILLGLSLDTYDAARILPFIVAAFLVFEAVRSRELLRKSYAGLAVFAILAVVVFSPLGWYALQHWAQFTQRTQFAWIGSQVDQAHSLRPLFVNIRDALLAFNFRANGADFFTTEPLLDIPISVLFPFGLVLSLTRFRERGHFLLLVMLVLTLAVGIASKPVGQRIIGAVIPTTAMAAIFLVEAWRWLARSYPARQTLFGIAMVALLLYSGYASYGRYLGPDRKPQWGFDVEATAVAKYMKSIEDDYQIHAAAGNWPVYTLTYLSYPGEGDAFAPTYTYATVAQDLLSIPPASDRGTAYIIEAVRSNVEVRDILAGRFPSATFTQILNPALQQSPIADVLLVPPGGGPDADLSAYVSPGAVERDAGRQEDLRRITVALLTYRDQTGSFPNTHNLINSACIQGALGSLCVLKGAVDANQLQDPRQALEFGYWYQSDGRTYTLYASFEALPPPGLACHRRSVELVDVPSLVCVHGE